ncbi:MAG TPA: MBL fold metallo-hydrolase [Candidatus Paceibacterota bacterium]|nr:MBL fold metallo-hydrolase [Candidatus Paceibacterota bacterium]
MKITKFGHCCMLIDIDGVKILTDPGSFTTEQNDVTGLDAVLITHSHGDHYHADSVPHLKNNNPDAIFVTNAEVGELLKKENVEFTKVGDGEKTDVKGISIEGFGTKHAEIYGDMGQVENTAYLVAEKFYFPGDNFEIPRKSVDVLALPVAGPWLKIKDVINFAKEIKARTAFGVHDGMIVPPFRGFVGTALKMFVLGTEYVSMQDGETREF